MRYMEQMKRESFFSKVWRVLSPLAAYYLLQIVVMIGVSTVFAMKYVSQVDLDGTNLDRVYQSLMQSVFNSIWDISFWCTILSAVMAVPVLVLYRKRDRKRAVMLGRNARYSSAGAAAFVIFPVLASAAALAGNNMMLLNGLLRGVDSGLAGQPILVALVGIGVVSPLAEELIFRVVMYDRVREYVRPLFAGIIVSALYAFLQTDPVQMVYVFLLSALFAYAYEKTHQWIIPVLMHVCANIMDILLTETQVFRFMFRSRTYLIGVTLTACMLVVVLVYLAEQRIRTVAVSDNG